MGEVVTTHELSRPSFQEETEQRLTQLKSFGRESQYNSELLSLNLTSIIHMAVKRLQQGVTDLAEVNDIRIRAASIASNVAAQHGDLISSFVYEKSAQVFTDMKQHINE
jgi:hypothetical protein